MKFIGICAQGLEDVAMEEVKEILNVSSKILIPGRIAFSAKSAKKLIEETQSIMKVYEFKQRCKNVEEIEVFNIEAPFRVICSRKGENNYSSQMVERDVGEKFFNKGSKVDLEEPKTIVFVDIVNEEVIVGVDLTPVLLSRRDYRIKVHNQSLNACVAYSVVRLSGYGEGKSLLDPFSKDGVIAIEALRYHKGTVYAYDGMFPNIRKLEINAKLAGLRKEVKVSRIEVEWLDTKFKEDEVDCVVSAVPFPSKNVKEKDVLKIYKELFYQLNFILKKGGKAVFIAPTLKLLKEMNEKLSVVDEREVFVGRLKYDLVLFSK